VLYPAFVAWGDAYNSRLKIRGQIYDAYIKSQPDNIDLTDTQAGLPVINYTDNYYYGSLWLFKGVATEPAVGSYMY